jgi:hypothetical protein
MVRRGNGVLKLAGGIFTVAGLAFLLAGLWTGNRQYTILRTWPTVEAEVTKSRVTHHLSREHVRRGGYVYITVYQAEIEFRYTLNGKQFTSLSTPGYTSSNPLEMKRMADTYAPGTRHTIRYNPAMPNDIRFNAGYNFGFFLDAVILGGMGVILTGLGISLLRASRSRQPLQCPACGQAVERGQKFCPNCAAPLPIGQ